MSDNGTKNSYHPVRITEDRTAGEETTKKQQIADEDANPDSLKDEERCCCSFMQRLASPYLFGFLVCIVFLIQSAAVAGAGGGALSTIEKRFQLKTSELAPFLIANDVVSVILVLFVAYYGHTSHRPRLIGGGGIIVGIGLLLCTLPQFIYDTPSQFSLEQGGGDGQNKNDTSANGDRVTYPVCRIDGNTTGDTEVCTVEEEMNSGSLMWQVTWIIIGQMLTGVGSSSISPLSVTYMDDSLKRTSTSVFVACMFIFSSLGPIVGFSIGGFCLSIHADFYKAPVYAQPGDLNWLGAWWLIYAITGILLIAVSIPIVMFPRKIRNRAERASTKEGDEETQQGANIGNMYRLTVRNEGSGKCANVKGFLSAIRRLVTNPTFMSLILGVCAMLSSIIGIFIFMAKYIETQFSVPASTAPMILGIMVTPGSLLGNLIGGFVVKKLKLTKKGMATMVVILKPFVLVFGVLMFFLGCDNLDIAGITKGYPIANTTTTYLPNLTAGCNTGCGCPSDYKPVCGSDGVTYATPCHAGCSAVVEKAAMEKEDNLTIYTNCSCLGDSNQLGSEDFIHTAVPGECQGDCNTLIPFIAITMVGTLLGNILGNPGFMLQLRTVDDDDRSIAIGFTSMMLRLLGLIPAPIIFGSAIQTACLLLQSSCGKTGNCLVYDIVHFRYVFFALSLGFEALATIAFVVCYFSIRESKNPEGFHAMSAVNSGDGTKSIGQEHDANQNTEARLDCKQYEESF